MPLPYNGLSQLQNSFGDTINKQTLIVCRTLDVQISFIQDDREGMLPILWWKCLLYQRRVLLFHGLHIAFLGKADKHLSFVQELWVEPAFRCKKMVAQRFFGVAQRWLSLLLAQPSEAVQPHQMRSDDLHKNAYKTRRAC